MKPYTIIKNIVTVCLIFLLSIQAKSQETNFTIGVIMPSSSTEFSDAQLLKMQSKITQIVNNSNQALMGYNNDFVIYPVATIDESNVVETGMQNMTVTKIDFSLFIKQLSSNTVYNTVSKKISGSGNNKEQSINNAIAQIKTTDDVYTQFITKAKEKIIKYYNDNCNNILLKADKLATTSDYEQAISILQSVPTTCTSCYTLAEKKSLEIFKKYQPILCKSNILKAKAAIAVNNFDEAIELLALIDPSANCFAEANKLISEISAKVTKKENQELDLTKLRINAIKEIGKSYYSKNIPQTKYNVVVQ